MKKHSLFNSGALFLCGWIASCGGAAKVTDGELVVIVSTDLEVPRDLDAISVQVFRGGSVERTERFEGNDLTLPLRTALRSEGGKRDDVLVKVVGGKAGQVIVVREGQARIPAAASLAVTLQLDWLCTGQVAQQVSLEELASARSSCPQGQTCIQGGCGTQILDANTFSAVPPANFDKCFDLASCVQTAPQTLNVNLTDCEIERPSSSVGLNIALAVSGGNSGVCVNGGCYVPLSGFEPAAGWIDNGTRISLARGVCAALLSGKVESVISCGHLATKTISVPSCSNQRMRPDGGIDPSPVVGVDGGANTDAAVAPDANPEKLDAAPVPLCGNGKLDPGELCEGNCPEFCETKSCEVVALENTGTCQAQCVVKSRESQCKSDDGCCPSACTSATDNDCACVPTAEVCNGRDDNCNGSVDEGVAAVYYRDADGDGFGTASGTQAACGVPTGFVANKSDCNDASALTAPGLPEICNGRDDNCDGIVDPSCPKFSDGGPACSYGTVATTTVLSLTKTYFADGKSIPAGTYELRYEDGCMQYVSVSQADWRVNWGGQWGWFFMQEGAGKPTARMPGLETTSATFNNCVAANKALPTVKLSLGAGVYFVNFVDSPLTDNQAGINGRNPKWSLWRKGYCP